MVSNAERRALTAGEDVAVPRVLDIYAALPSITGKLELEYEGELKGGDAVARELIRVGRRQGLHQLFRGRERVADRAVVRTGRIAEAGRDVDSAEHGEAARQHPGADGEDRARSGLGASEPDAVRASAAEFILEGLYAHRRISRNEEARVHGRRAQARTHRSRQRRRGGRPRRQFN